MFVSRARLGVALLTVCACFSLVSQVPAAETAVSESTAATDPSATAADQQAVFEKTVSRGISFLTNKGQADDGSYSSFAGPGVTALITTALIQHGRAIEDPAVARGLKYLEGFVRDDGGVHQEGTLYRNYETSLAVLCFSAANADGRYDKVIQKADGFLKGIQWDETEDKDISDPAYGGAGYGKHNRPDLSNTSFMVEALRAAGNDANSQAMQRALTFISRCQNYESSQNTTPYAAKNPDGGFYYTPAPGQSQAGETANGGLRSYGSMTYAGLKSMLYAGVGPNDPRVQAALKWIRKHYNLTTNPGLGDAGLYYYYHTFAKALAAQGQQLVRDDQGQEHDWRAELIAQLAARQREDGSWANENPRWMEGDANLVTGYALLALSYCRPAEADTPPKTD